MITHISELTDHEYAIIQGAVQTLMGKLQDVVPVNEDGETALLSTNIAFGIGIEFAVQMIYSLGHGLLSIDDSPTAQTALHEIAIEALRDRLAQLPMPTQATK